MVETTTTPSTVAPYVSEIYKDPANWICRADMADTCDNAEPLTEVAADGTLTVKPYEVAVDPPLDCFYVYPTVSDDTTFNSDFVPSNEVVATNLQAARFNQVCKVYAPMYRSVTLGGLFGSIPGDFDTGMEHRVSGRARCVAALHGQRQPRPARGDPGPFAGKLPRRAAAA